MDYWNQLKRNLVLDLYDLNPEFFIKNLTSDPSPTDYQAVVEHISNQQGVPKETVAAIIIEFKGWVRIEDILENASS